MTAIHFRATRCVCVASSSFTLFMFNNGGLNMFNENSENCNVNRFSCNAWILQVPIRATPENGFLLSKEQLKAALTPRTRMVVLCNPSNPTGACVLALSHLLTPYASYLFSGVCISANDFVLHTKFFLLSFDTLTNPLECLEVHFLHVLCVRACRTICI